MHIHILGICGTFMGGLAILARQAGHQVSGSDEHVYPPMSTQLEQQGIALTQGFDPSQLDTRPDMVIVGNVMTRGNPIIEYVLNRNIPYTSGPQWLYENVLRDKWVIGVAGTHGKTSTSSMVAWILQFAKMQPGYLIGGIPANFGQSAHLGDSDFFVVEADEYDTAFFDKRSKFVHYHPRTLINNNLEFDHADIFENLAAIQKQFHHLIRTVPGEGLIINDGDNKALDEVMAMGCWTPVEKIHVGMSTPQGWNARNLSDDSSEFDIYLDDNYQGHLKWNQMGQHNVNNAMAAIVASRHAGVPVVQSIEALTQFKGVKRRLELRADTNGICLYDDFAHHPTAIETTLKGLRGHVGGAKIWTLLEPRSNTMRMGVHQQRLAASLSESDYVLLFQPEGMDWSLQNTVDSIGAQASLYTRVDEMVAYLENHVQAGDHIVVMSNGGFAGIHQKLENMLKLL